MNKYEEAFNRIIWLLEKLADWNGYDLSDLDENYNYVEDEKKVIELLEKAIPKKPIRIGTYKEDVLCPTCKSDYTWLSKTVGWEREMVMFPHCAKCSQAIDWGKDNE